MLLAALLSLLNLIVSYAVYCCARLSPLFNMIISIPILLLWTVGMGLLVYNIYGTLAHSCSTTNWANDDGVSVCGKYKAFFSFVVVGWLCQVALIIVDVRAKKTERALMKYDKMGGNDKDVKLADLDHSRNASDNEIPYGLDDFRRRAESVNSQNQRHPSPYRDQAVSTQRPQYQSPYGSESSQVHRLDDFYYQTPAHEPTSYLPQQTTYSPQTHYYQPTYDGMRLR
jgi:hypothetical protein